MFNRDYPRNNVHRTSERHHKEVCETNRHRGSVHTIAGDSNLHRDNNSLIHRLEPAGPSGSSGRDSSTLGKLPRTQYPATTNSGSNRHNKHNRDGSREGSHSPIISHNRYLPKKRRSSRGYSPTVSRRNSRVEDTAFDGMYYVLRLYLLLLLP